MKNTPLSALVLLAAAGLVGAVAFFALGDDPQQPESKVVQVTTVSETPKVMNLTPHEQRKQERLEATKRQIEEYKKIGKVLPNGEIKVPDVDGSPLYIHPELIEGVGRYGEPIYALAKYKRRAAVPLRQTIRSRVKNEEAQPKLKKVDGTVLTLGKKNEGGKKPKGAAAGAEGSGKKDAASPEDG